MNKRATQELPTPVITGKTSEFFTETGLKVKVIYPDNVPEHLRRQKINRLYDILSGDNREKVNN